MTQASVLTTNQPRVAQLSQPSLWQILRFFKSFFWTMIEEKDMQPVIDMSAVLSEMPVQEEAATYLKQDPSCAALIRERYIPPAHDLDQLLTLAPDTLGYQYAAAIKKMGFDPNLHAGLTAETDGKYVELRLSQTHDIWHVMTGFDVSISGELGLLAFYLPQLPHPTSIGVIASSLIGSMIWKPKDLPAMIEAIAQGFAMGKAAQPLFAQKWEEGWDKPLAQWRTDLNIHMKSG